jgi:hypothetical protein
VTQGDGRPTGHARSGRRRTRPLAPPDIGTRPASSRPPKPVPRHGIEGRQPRRASAGPAPRAGAPATGRRSGAVVRGAGDEVPGTTVAAPPPGPALARLHPPATDRRPGLTVTAMPRRGRVAVRGSSRSARSGPLTATPPIAGGDMSYLRERRRDPRQRHGIKGSACGRPAVPAPDRPHGPALLRGTPPAGPFEGSCHHKPLSLTAAAAPPRPALARLRARLGHRTGSEGVRRSGGGHGPGDAREAAPRSAGHRHHDARPDRGCLGPLSPSPGRRTARSAGRSSRLPAGSPP